MFQRSGLREQPKELKSKDDPPFITTSAEVSRM